MKFLDVNFSFRSPFKHFKTPMHAEINNLNLSSNYKSLLEALIKDLKVRSNIVREINYKLKTRKTNHAHYTDYEHFPTGRDKVKFKLLECPYEEI